MRYIRAVEQSAETPLGIDPDAYALQDPSAQLSILHEAMVRAKIVPSGSTPADLRGPVRVYCAALRTSYQPRWLYRQPMRLVFAPDAGFGHPAARCEEDAALAGWSRCARNIEIWQGRGNHWTLLKAPHVQDLAAWWQLAR